MSVLSVPPPASLILSIFSSQWEAFWPDLLTRLEEAFGPADFISEPLAFDHTAYYEREFGSPITRRILGFAQEAPQDSLADIKLRANALEAALMTGDRRRIANLDPGFITAERLVLATGKNFTHRVYLKKGVFADLTLIYQKGDWRALPWTFPDYNSREIRTILTQRRERHLAKRARAANDPLKRSDPCSPA